MRGELNAVNALFSVTHLFIDIGISKVAQTPTLGLVASHFIGPSRGKKANQVRKWGNHRVSSSNPQLDEVTQ